MKALEIKDFYKLEDTEDYFNFFELEFDQTLINVKRFHIMKEYGSLIKKGINSISLEYKLLKFLKFSLLRVYGDYKNGHCPSAADVWKLYEGGRLDGCSSCGTSKKESSCAC